MNIKLTDNETIFLLPTESGHFDQINKIEVNRAFLFGDGLFETMIYTGGKIRFKDSHLARLLEGCKTLQMNYENTYLLDEFELFLQKNLKSGLSCRIRWNIYRNGLGKYTPETYRIKEFFSLQLYKYQQPQRKKAYINQSIKVPQLPWSNCKTLNSLVYVMANEERKKKKYEEVILLNAIDYICETGAANIFWIRNNIYYTPSLRSNCISGVGRLQILKYLQEQDIEVIKGEFRQKDLLGSDQIFTSNVTGINYISSIDLREYDTTPIMYLEDLFGL